MEWRRHSGNEREKDQQRRKFGGPNKRENEEKTEKTSVIQEFIVTLALILEKRKREEMNENY